MESSLPKGAIEIADVDLLRREDEYFVVKANCISPIMQLALNCSAELPEERKDMKCPKCKSQSITHFAGGVTGTYLCKECGYVGVFVIEEEERPPK